MVLAVQYFTAGTNHYHFPDHALSGNSPYIASTFLMAVTCREPINILCPRESFFATLLSFLPSVFVTLLASGQSHTN